MRNCIVLLLCCLSVAASCSKTDIPGKDKDPLANYRWVEGHYSGTYMTVSASSNNNDEFMKLYSNPPWTEKSITAKIELNRDTTINLFIRGGYNSTAENMAFTINNDTTQISLGRYSLSKQSQSMKFSSFNYGVYNNGWGGGWIRGESLSAYKDIE